MLEILSQNVLKMTMYVKTCQWALLSMHLHAGKQDGIQIF